MAILTSTPGEDNKVNVYDVPDDVLAQYAITPEKAAAMFPESAKPGDDEVPKSDASMSPTRVDNAEGLAEVQAYNGMCVCRKLICNAYGCSWHYYYCYC